MNRIIQLGDINTYRLNYRLKDGDIRRNITEMLLYCLVFFLAFMPSDSMNFKMISLCLVLLLNGDIIIKSMLKVKYLYITIYAVIFCGFLILISTLVNNLDIRSSVSIAYIMLYLLIVPIILWHNIDYQKIIIAVLTILAIVIAASGLMDVVGICKLSNNYLLNFLNQRGEANIGYWPTTTFGYVLFFKASSLLIVLVGYTVAKNKYVLLVITIIAMAFTGTRANLFASIMLVIVYYFIYQRTTALKVIAILAICSIFIFKLETIVSYVQNSFILKQSTDTIKIEHLKSIYKLLRDNPLYIITGSGLGSFFYSTGINDYTRLTELAYFDLFRQIGLISFIPFMYFLFKPMKALFADKENVWFALAYIGHLLIAFTNPLLFSSTPFTLYILTYLIYMKYMDSRNYINNTYRRATMNF